VTICALSVAFVITDEQPVTHKGTLPDTCADVVRSVFAQGTAELLDAEAHRLVYDGDKAVLLTSHSWMMAANGVIRGPYGGRQRGAPGYIADAQDAAITDSAMLILDAATDRVRYFAHDGLPVRHQQIQHAGGSWWQPRQLFVINGDLVIGALEPELAPRPLVLLRWYAGRRDPDTVYRSAGTSMNGIVMDHDQRGITIGESGTYRIHTIDSSGVITATFSRRDPPRYPFNREERRRYRSYWSRLPPSVQVTYELPAYFPPLAALRNITDERIAAAVAIGPDSVHVEIIDHAGNALCRVTRSAISRPFALGRDGVIWLEETDEHLTVMKLSYGHAN
jgi:hypothetical protein